MDCRHRAHHQIRAKDTGRVRADVEPGFQARPDQQRHMARDHLRRLFNRRGQLRHDRADDRAFKILGYDMIEGKNGFELHRILISGPGAVGRQAGNKEQLSLSIYTHRDIAVADIDC